VSHPTASDGRPPLNTLATVGGLQRDRNEGRNRGATLDVAAHPAARLVQRRLPYTILAGIQVAAAVVCLGFVVPGVTAEIAPSRYYSIAGALVASGALTWLVMPLLPHDYGIDVGLALVYLMAAGAMVVTPTDEGQVLVGLGLTVFGVFAGYFLPLRRLLWSLLLMIGSYAIAEMANPRMSSTGVAVMVAVVIGGVSLLVGWLAQRLRDVALHDGLTGLLNRRGLDLLAPPVLSACARTGTPVTVGLLDLDDFKAYNDAHGHLAGDQFLAQTAHAWRTALRESDLAARFGGDEFAIVLVGSTEAEARELARRVCVTPGGDCAGVWTVGWATLRPRETLYDALGRADAELLATKAARRTGR